MNTQAKQDVKLVCVKSDVLDDWYLIEKVDHEHVQELRPFEGIPNCMGLYDSSRISDADVEGRGVEMLAIADAIEKRSTVSFKRCAVECDVPIGLVRFCSPRNSQREGFTTLACADELVKSIRSVVAKVSP